MRAEPGLDRSFGRGLRVLSYDWFRTTYLINYHEAFAYRKSVCSRFCKVLYKFVRFQEEVDESARE